jgi:hypothetical protein
MDFRFNITVVKLILVNLIPVIGVLFFHWEIFEIAVSYILESSAAFIVFNIDVNLVNKSTRRLPLAGIFQTVFFVGFFAMFMFFYVLILFAICEDPPPDRMENTLFPELMDMHIWPVFTAFILLEMIVFYIKVKKELAHPEDNFWRVMNRFIYLHLLVFAGAVVFCWAVISLPVAYAVFISVKLLHDIWRLITDRKKKPVERKLKRSHPLRIFRTKRVAPDDYYR